MNSDPAHKRGSVQRIQEVLFSMNIGFAVAYGLFAYVGDSLVAVHASNSIRNFLQAFGQTLLRIAPLGVNGRSKSDLLRSAIIDEAVFVALVLGIALILYLLVRLFARSVAGRLTFTAISGLAALVAVPGCWLYIVHATWGLHEPRTFGATYGYMSVLEIIVAGGLLYFVRNQPIWRGTLLLGLHYAFWVLVIGERSFAPVLVSIPFSLVFPGSGFAWLRYVRAQTTAI